MHSNLAVFNFSHLVVNVCVCACGIRDSDSNSTCKIVFLGIVSFFQCSFFPFLVSLFFCIFQFLFFFSHLSSFFKIFSKKWMGI